MIAEACQIALAGGVHPNPSMSYLTLNFIICTITRIQAFLFPDIGWSGVPALEGGHSQVLGARLCAPCSTTRHHSTFCIVAFDYICPPILTLNFHPFASPLQGHQRSKRLGYRCRSR